MDDNLGLHHGFLFGCIVLNQVTFWFFRHRILTTWTHRRNQPWFFYILDKSGCENQRRGRRIFNIGWISQMDRMEMDFWFLGGLDGIHSTEHNEGNRCYILL
ncbi:hypothetical protein RhiirA5_381232 [Rhizophagus irregularis]|uniref:Uncharacterized protein n=1 Tax=Rhizophagus irregularis TaxID=588596 RepID=A0A2N0P5H0_9GLOM|nr:hypothetical protein RhiirA5_381232 [Rhizophagus irregularis]